MKRPQLLEKEIFEINSKAGFESIAMEVFAYQYASNPVYQRFCDLLGRKVERLGDIPFLPIELFKTHTILCGNQDTIPELIFSSSGTTGTTVSKHFVAKPGLYRSSFFKAFEQFYAQVSDYRIFALLPSYLERSGSSLVYMAAELIEQSSHAESGFFLNNIDALRELLLAPSDRKTLLIGVSYALLDLVEMSTLTLHNTIVMETGGMKGRREEITRAALHEALRKGLGVSHIHSEYGMTELLSQAYAKNDGQFETPPWMKLLIRDANDPFSSAHQGRTGGVNVIDLANLYSCSFIATSDLGRTLPNGKTEILGRMDYSDMRGCNLMVGF